MERIGRIGYLAKGLVFICGGLLSAAAALSGRARAAYSGGVMRAIVQQPFGHALLLALILGLVCYVVWRLLAAIVDAEDRGTDAKGLALGARSLFIAVLYSGITFAAVKTLLGFGGWPFGTVAAGLAAYGIYCCVRGWFGKFAR